MNDGPSQVELSWLPAHGVRAAAAMAARAMTSDPMSVTVFDDEAKRIRSLETMFRLTLTSLKCPALMATKNGGVVGLVAFARPRECIFQQMDARRKVIRVGTRTFCFALPSIPLRNLPDLLRIGSGPLRRMSAWIDVTARHDPKDLHQHIELVAVDPEFQGQGIGRLMMERVLREMEGFEGFPYLETNTEADVRFYERMGFEVTDADEALGINIRFMAKPVDDSGKRG